MIEEKFRIDGIDISGILWKSDGPDIVATNENRIWKVECKGLGGGKPSTLRNNFDRALASVVTYWDIEGKEQCIAISLPYNEFYNSQIEIRVKLSLRKHLNLWILLYIPNYKILPFSPDLEFSGETIVNSLAKQAIT
ncbi:MAG: hypothetical protein ACRENZ_06125 [Thermodesulfobacteriota bacterium]